MPILHLAILALIQGITEFLPISSSGHLALYPLLTGRPDQGLQIDVAVHLGTLAAVMLYFRSEVALMVRGGLKLLTGRFGEPDSRLALFLVLATIPAVLFGLALSTLGLSASLRSLAVIGWATLIGGVLLWLADRVGAERKAAEDWSLRDALAMGVAQALALIPGMSRSGVTMTAARGLGYERVESARLSMLMSIPVIVAAGSLVGLELAEAGDAALGLDAAIAALLSFGAALAAIAIFMKMLETWSMTVFAVYRLLLGGVLLWIVYA